MSVVLALDFLLGEKSVLRFVLKCFNVERNSCKENHKPGLRVDNMCTSTSHYQIKNTSEVLVAAIAANELLGYKFCTTHSGFLTIFKLTKYCEVLEAIDLS